MKKRLLIALTALIATTSMAADYVTNASEIVSAANWDKMKTIRVEMDEYAYSFDDLVLEANQPYKLELVNKGEKKHYFTAPEFYKAIATRKVQSDKDGEIKAPYFTAIELMVGGQLDLYFVPVNAGEFEVYCTIKGHRDDGMEAFITIK
jgi:uncharacterized cupredoxin-like copper-binding protein